MADSNETAKIKGRAYAKGYAAGRARIEREIDKEVRQQRERADFVALYAAIFTGCLQNAGWSTGDKPWASGSDYARGCANIADEAMKHVRKRYG